MRILLVHNHYQQPGGEDMVFENEKNILEDAGHAVFVYKRYNEEINQYSVTQKLALFPQTLWNTKSAKAIQNILTCVKPEIVHFTNTFPLISPSAYYVVQEAGIPIVQSLHNFRLLCPNALFYRANHICEDCLGKLIPWPGIIHACYQDSRAATGVTSAMLTIHRLLKTWEKTVTIYIAGFPEFAREKFIQGGLPPEKIRLKPNFVYPDPGIGDGQGNYALFVGRFAPEKGLDTILQAWQNFDIKVPLKIIGDGTLTPQVIAASQQSTYINWLGRKSLAELYDIMKKAAVLIFPSTWYEAMPRTIIDAFAVGTPVIASNIGAMSNLIHHGKNGLHFKPNDVQDLVEKIEWVFTHPTELSHMRRAARMEYEKTYTAEINYEMLMDIYQAAITKNREFSWLGKT